MKIGRRELENVVNNYKKIAKRNFVPASKLSSRQLSNAAKHSGRRIKENDIIAFLDTTLFSSGKDGILLTEKILLSFENKYSGIDIQLVVKAEVSGKEVKVFYPSGGYKRVKISNYAEETASLLNAIAKERLLLEKAALEKEAVEIEKQEKTEPPKKAEPPKKPKAETVPPKPAPKIEANPEKKSPEVVDVSALDEEKLFYYANKIYNEGRKAEAFACYKKSADMGNTYAMCAAAEMIFSGELGEGREEEGLEFLDKAKSLREKMADGTEYKFREIIAETRKKTETQKIFEKAKKDLGKGFYDRAVGGFKKAANSGHAEAMYELGILTESGKTGERNIDKAIFWLEKAKENGIFKGNDVLERLRNEKEQQKLVPKTKETYSGLFKKALAGDVPSMVKIAEICEKEGNYDSEEKWHEAFFWNLRAAENGNSYAAGNVGRFLEKGIGVPINRQKAIEWYEKSPETTGDLDRLVNGIEEGYIVAVPDRYEYMDYVQWAGDFGELVLENEVTFEQRFYGYALIYISAVLGYEEAQFMLGKLYMEGSEMGESDRREGEYWLKEAFYNGCSEAAEYAEENSIYFD